MFACNSEPEDYVDFSSREEASENTSGPDSDTENDPSPDTEEPDTAEEEEPVISFRTRDINCTEIQYRTMIFTKMLLGGLDSEDEPMAVFYGEKERFDISNPSLVKTEILGSTQNSDDNPSDCGFSLSLSEPSPDELQEVTELIDGNVVETGVQWAFYFPSTYVHQDISCQINEISSDNNTKVSCEAVYEKGQSPVPAAEENDSELSQGHIYDWGADVLLVFISGNIQGSFGDLGFEMGWNLAQFDKGEIILVEPLNALDQLSSIEIDNRIFLPRPNISVRGLLTLDHGFSDTFSIGAMPAAWIEEVGSTSTMSSIFYEETSTTWTMDIWGEPESSQLLETSFLPTSDGYKQWSSYVDVSAFIPMVFTGEPSIMTEVLDSEGDGTDVFNVTLGDNITYTSTREGAVCKNSDTVTFVHYAAANRPSEIFWYILSEIQPGWHATHGIHKQETSWRFIIENTDLSINATYADLSIGSGCNLPVLWNPNP